MWLFNVNGFQSAVEFDPPLVKIEPTEYDVKPDGKTDYNKVVKEAVYGTERVCQEQIDQLKDYTPATKTHLSSHLLVRARIKEDLEVLKDYDENAVFFEDLTADYQYRCIIARRKYAEYVYSAVAKIDYNSHVKETMEREAPKIPGGRYTVLSSIWSLVSKWQPNPPYGSKWTNYGSTTYYGTGKTSKSGVSATPGTGYMGVKTYKEESKAISGTVIAPPYSSSYEDDYAWEMIDPLWLNGEVDVDPDDVDNPAMSMTEMDLAIASGNATFETMEMQLKDILKEINLLGTVDISSAVEALVESFGTCDVSTIKELDLFDIIYQNGNK